MTVTRKRFTAKIKFKVVCELLSGKKTQAEITSEYGVHPTQQNTWKKEFMNRGELVFETKDKTEEQFKKEVEKLESTIGHYAYKVQWLEKKIGKFM